jgi:hypothetical protein
MDPSSETIDVRSAGVTPGQYVPPQVRALGNVHDLLAGLGSGTFDCATQAAPGDDFSPDNCVPGGG